MSDAYDPLDEYEGCLTQLLRARDERDSRIAELEAKAEGLEQKLKEAEAEKAIGWAESKELRKQLAAAIECIQKDCPISEDTIREELTSALLRPQA